MGDAGVLVDTERPERGLLFDGRIAEDFKLLNGHLGERRHAARRAALHPGAPWGRCARDWTRSIRGRRARLAVGGCPSGDRSIRLGCVRSGDRRQVARATTWSRFVAGGGPRAVPRRPHERNCTRIGVVMATQGASVVEVRTQVEQAEQLGFDSAWMPGIPNGPDVLMLLARAGASTSRVELGPAIVATAPRHPVALACQALTVNDALAGRLTLCIGASHQRIVEGLWGLGHDRPALRMREYLSVLVRLLERQDVRFTGELMSTTYRLDASRSGLRAGRTRPRSTRPLHRSGRCAVPPSLERSY